MATEKGLTAYIYRWSLGDCSKGGISSRVNEVTVLGLPRGQIFEPTPEAPPVRLVVRTLWGKRVVHAEPVLSPEEAAVKRGQPMAGGTYIASGDSRFSEFVGFYGAISLHDRWE